MLDALDDTFDRRRKARNDSLNSSQPATNTGKKTFDMFEPEAVCFTEERFGSRERYKAFHDGMFSSHPLILYLYSLSTTTFMFTIPTTLLPCPGPKFVCGVGILAARSNSSTGCLVYSIGSNNQIDFEIAVNSFLGCETHTFDPTLGSPFIGEEYATFHDWGLGKDGDEMSSVGKKWTAKSLEHIMQDLRHENRTIDILKVCIYHIIILCVCLLWTCIHSFFRLVYLD